MTGDAGYADVSSHDRWGSLRRSTLPQRADGNARVAEKRRPDAARRDDPDRGRAGDCGAAGEDTADGAVRGVSGHARRTAVRLDVNCGATLRGSFGPGIR